MKTSFVLIYFCFTVAVLKVILFLITLNSGTIVLGGGSDADLYHAIATGEISVVKGVSIWPYWLNSLFNIGLYQRNYVVIFYQFLNIIIVPFLFFLLVKPANKGYSLNPIILMLLIIMIYPTVSIKSLDIYRDLFMILLFFLAIISAKQSIEVGNLIGYILFFVLVYFLLELRVYLGLSLILAFFSYPFLSSISKPIRSIILYMLGLIVIKELGLIDLLLDYRGDGWESGSTSLGIGLLNTSTIDFVFWFFISYLAQVFGVFFPNFLSLLVFVFESVPFILCCIFLARNKGHFSSFVWFLLTFAIIYNSVWVIGNDNLGTATRLRVFTYYSIFISAVIVFY
jgi:hypothetical protein